MGFSYTVTVDESMTGDRYRAELEAWRKERDAEVSEVY